jgi:hypothetical protein
MCALSYDNAEVCPLRKFGYPDIAGDAGRVRTLVDQQNVLWGDPVVI